MIRTAWTAPALVALLLVTLTACGDDAPASRGPAATPATSASLPAGLAGFEEFAGVTLPPSAQDVDIEQTEREFGPQYLVTFRAPVDDARAFCAANGLGGVAAEGRVDDQTREEFGFTGDAAATFRCYASKPTELRVQRRVLADVAGDVATVRVKAFRMPPR